MIHYKTSFQYRTAASSLSSEEKWKRSGYTHGPFSHPEKHERGPQSRFEPSSFIISQHKKVNNQIFEHVSIAQLLQKYKISSTIFMITTIYTKQVVWLKLLT